MLMVKDVHLDFDHLKVIDGVSFELNDEEIVVIIGPSGCGKSSLLRMIAHLEQPTSGSITGDYQRMGFVFQDDRLLPWLDVYDNIKIVNDIEDKDEIDKLLDAVDLNGFESYKPDQLSGGMKKRCGLARAFYYNSDLLLMDEPFSGLDYSLRQDMIKLLLRLWQNKKKPILFITHEIDEAIKVANRILVMSPRPSKIIKEYKIPKKPNKDQLNKIREDIIDLIT